MRTTVREVQVGQFSTGGVGQFYSGANKRYLLNAYRVLLTRARQGIVIFVPLGDELDLTRVPAFYDETYEYFTGIGVTQV